MELDDGLPFAHCLVLSAHGVRGTSDKPFTKTKTFNEPQLRHVSKHVSQSKKIIDFKRHMLCKLLQAYTEEIDETRESNKPKKREWSYFRFVSKKHEKVVAKRTVAIARYVISMSTILASCNKQLIGFIHHLKSIFLCYTLSFFTLRHVS